MIDMQVFNTKWVAKRLGCSETWVHKLVGAGKLKAYVYDDNGVLIERKPEEKRRGQGLYFRACDVDTYQPAVQRRPRGSKNKRPSFPGMTGKNGLTVLEDCCTLW